ncbi:hypothetical protein DY000_02002506 [Brassica cretica]|uniref:Uncharacterized protein n=1 Tax=Brassica cretica TaxID=69181 RepID=A0ABQ7C2H4_BRACR|nr:hypothetical protein DY000_02002506 [Brassica cretica]
MALVWKYGERKGYVSWKGLSWGMAERCTYGERILGSSSEYVQSNITRYFSDPQYYFQTFSDQPLSKTSSCFASNDQGHWARISEPVGGRLSYKPPIYDINAPDLYIPFMAFGTYVVLAGLSLGLNGKSSYWYFVAEV